MRGSTPVMVFRKARERVCFEGGRRDTPSSGGDMLSLLLVLSLSAFFWSEAAGSVAVDESESCRRRA
jgi:hypothetical protein